MTSALYVFLAFLIGLGAGTALDHAPLTAAIEPIGKLWINALRMPVLPLIVALTITGIARTRDTRDAGALTLRALLTFIALIALFTAVMTPLAPILLGGMTLAPEAVAELQAGAPAPAAAPALTLSGWFTSLIPVNPVQAAAEGALLPLVVVALLYGLALTRVAEATRRLQVDFFQGVADVLIVLIRWVLRLAPIGVFALAFALGERVGLPAAGAVAHYLAVTTAAILVAGVVLGLLTVVVGRVAPRAFVAALGPSLAIALSSRSSLAALPALIDGVRRHLALPERVTGVVIPLGASVFKFNAAITWAFGAVFVATLYGRELAGTNLLLFGLGTVLLSLTTPGIPSGGFFVQAPLYALVGLPPEGLGILIAIDLIPDIFKTAINVMGYASAATLVARFDRTPAEDPPS